MSSGRVLPRELTYMVEQYVDSQLADEAKYDNRWPLDESGVWSLHRLAADIYAAGWAEGEAVEAERGRAQRRRERDALKSSEGATSE